MPHWEVQQAPIGRWLWIWGAPADETSSRYPGLSKEAAAVLRRAAAAADDDGSLFGDGAPALAAPSSGSSPHVNALRKVAVHKFYTRLIHAKKCVTCSQFSGTIKAEGGFKLFCQPLGKKASESNATRQMEVAMDGGEEGDEEDEDEEEQGGGAAPSSEMRQ